MHGQLVAAQARDRLLGEQLEVAKAEVARAQSADRRHRWRASSASQKLIGRIARSSYQDGGMGELAVVLQSQSPDEFATRLVLVQNAMRSEGNVLSGLAEARANLAAQRATLVAKRKQVAGDEARSRRRWSSRSPGLQAQAIDAQHEVESLIAERERGGRRDRAGEGGRGGAATRRCRPSRPRLGRILAARARRPAARPRGPGGTRRYSGGGGSGALSLAGAAAGITSPYGMRVHPVTGIYKLHDGTDFGVGCGTPVHAAASGTVIQAALTSSATATSWSSTTAAMRGVGRGHQLQPPDALQRRATARTSAAARSSATAAAARACTAPGYSTGCHLHFMVYVNGGTTDPMGWL